MAQATGLSVESFTCRNGVEIGVGHAYDIYQPLTYTHLIEVFSR